MASMEPCMVRRMVAFFGQPGFIQIDAINKLLNHIMF